MLTNVRRRPLYPNGPMISPIGFGTYRVGKHPRLGFPECENALKKALKEGVNLIDTSTNYGDGLSEHLIGQTLKSMIAEGLIKREDVVIASKAGYIQGSNMELLQMRETEGKLYESVYKFSDDIWYSIDPAFVLDQFERSRARLGVEKIDVYFIHNPEYVLKYFEMENTPVETAREQFYRQLGKAMNVLEDLVHQGKLGCYGISSNTLGFSENDRSTVQLSKCLEVAESLGKADAHNFKVVQCPINWIEPYPALAPSEPGNLSVCEYAAQKGIGVLANRPLNAMHQNGLIRLARPKLSTEAREKLSADDKEGLKNWEKLCADLERLVHEQIDTPGYHDAPLSQLVLASLMWVPGVSSVLCGMRKCEYVDDALAAMKLPTLLYANRILSQIFENLEFTRTESE